MRGLVLLLALAIIPSVARGAPLPGSCIIAGALRTCDDHDPCTADRCQDGRCVHEPLTGPACDDHDGCTQNDHCEAGVCTGSPVACPDDGLACTDDVCLDGGCVHVPVDSRCVRSGACTDAVCAPERSDRDAAGCAPGSTVRDEGQQCSEDGDVCTTDVCRSGACLHVEATDAATCAPLEGAFRRALLVASLVHDLGSVAATTGTPELGERMGHLAADAAVTVETLAGQLSIDAPDPSVSADVVLRRRAQTALGLAAQTRREASGFAYALRTHAIRARVAGDVASELAVRSRRVRHASGGLVAELRRVLHVTYRFAR